MAVLRKMRNCSHSKEVREKTDKEQLLSSLGSPAVVGTHEFLVVVFGVVVGFSPGIGL